MADTLTTLVEEVQYELSQSASPAVGVNFREHIKNRIRRVYRWLWNDYNWPHLEEWFEKPLQAGQRYYDFPDGISLETINSVWRIWSGTRERIERGIDPSHYGFRDSDADSRADPVLRWAPKGAQFEVWPMPASDVCAIQFVAKRPFVQMVEDDSLCLLDTDLVVLFSAGHLIAKFNEKESNRILLRAERTYSKLKSRQRRTAKVVNLAGICEPKDDRPRFMVGVATGGAANVGSTDAEFAIFVPGMPGAGELVLTYNVTDGFTLQEADCSASCETPAAAQAVFSITRDGVPFGTVTFAAGQTEGVVDLGGATFVPDQVLRVIAPDPADIALADIAITLNGTR